MGHLGEIEPPDPNPDPARVSDTTTAQTLAILTVFHVIALIFVGLRTYTRALVIKSFGRDDAVIAGAALCDIVGWITFVVQARHGLGRHYDLLSIEDTLINRQALFFQTILLSNWSMCLLKVSIALNLLRFYNGTRWYFWSLWLIIGFVSTYSVVYFVLNIVHCRPLAGFWDPSLHAQCFDIGLYVKLAVANTVCSMSTDVILATLPVPIVWNIRLGLKVRLYLVGILSLGYFAVALGIIKTVYQTRYGRDKDRTYTQGVPFWGFLQLQVGIIAACSVSLRPLFSKWLKLGTIGSHTSPSDSKCRRRSIGKIQLNTYKSQRSQKATTTNEFELEESTKAFAVDTEGLQAGHHVLNSGGVNTFYRDGPDDSSSDNIIIQGDRVRANGGIERTTEVTVEYHV